MNNLINTGLILLCALLSSTCFAQFSDEYKNAQEKYPEATFLRLKENINVYISLKNDKISIRKEYEEEDIYLKDNATQGSKNSIAFSAFFEIESIEASSYQFKNGKYQEYKVEDFVQKDDLENSFYDDTKSLSFIYQNLSKGGKTSLKYTEVIKNPRFLNPFYLGNFYPIEYKKVNFIVEDGIDIKFKEFNISPNSVNFSTEKKRGKTIYSWVLKDKDELDYESNVPSYKEVLPHIVPIITSYTTKGVKTNLLNDVSGLYAWYHSMVKNINQEPIDEELKTLTLLLIKDKASNLEKVKAIYYWVQQNIKYIDFEYALGGFIPREANDVFKKKYGDCKDNSSILQEMLKVAGLKGQLTWIGTRSIPYKYNEVPTPIVDNHMILAYEEEDSTYYLDATGRYLPIDMPSSFIQGKEALIANGEGDFHIKEVPIVDPERNSFVDKSFLNLDGSSLNGSSVLELDGYYKIDFFNQLEDKNNSEKIKEYYNYKLQKGNNKFLISDISEDHKYDYTKKFKVSYDFSVNDYVKTFDNEIFVNLNLNQDASNFKTEKDRKYPIEVHYKSYYNYESELTIPNGYTLAYAPENFSISDELLDCEINYTVNDNTIVYKQILTMKYLKLDGPTQKKLNELIKSIEKQYKETIVLNKKS